MRALCFLPLLSLVPLAAADDRAKEEASDAEKLCAAELPRWKLTAAGAALDNPKEPVLRWTNPDAGRVYGSTYVWLHNGRPAAVGSMFRNVHPWNTFNGELGALAGTKLVAKRDDKVIWQPKDEWQWNPVAGAPAPAATAPQRLVQMKALAGEFAVELLDTRNVPKGDEQVPRLLPKPLVRYDLTRTKTLDGALFAFVLGTDPELMLLLECDTAAAKSEWKFGAVRMNRDAVRMKHKGASVYEAAATKTHRPEDAYLFFDLGLPRKEKP
ncbi:Uncharacterized protein OS=Planctomyces maris DSM 8797 GN=PM8797T_23941 PE=4 SV=1 [Gemmata massiliana]|uniref:Uncharacterized protein n=1 Tax=Gemmata massiliana TaxID=1210884 RepID=A0A6P2D6T4_9BACT|nr:hypothetical protein [Gemmata massiliana]VTR96165.1 Uncharacterized protein OS=Planctomyces maris DSM 8797 GN=PM8797T_23941 PE=4 SV=1 [Gemmata massiliana]